MLFVIPPPMASKVEATCQSKLAWPRYTVGSRHNPYTIGVTIIRYSIACFLFGVPADRRAVSLEHHGDHSMEDSSK